MRLTIFLKFCYSYIISQRFYFKFCFDDTNKKKNCIPKTPNNTKYDSISDHAVNLKISFLQIEQPKPSYFIILFGIYPAIYFNPIVWRNWDEIYLFLFQMNIFFLSTFVFDWGENFKYLLENRSSCFFFLFALNKVFCLLFFFEKTIFGSLVLCWGTLNNNMGCEFVVWLLN